MATPRGSYGELQNIVSQIGSTPNALSTIGLEVVELWPKPPQPMVPENIPASIERAMLQAERNFPIEGNEEASATMYRRALELALKDQFPHLRGPLAARIKKLVEDKTLPKIMGDWADEIRDLGNEAVHDATEVERSELTAIRGFADATLKYLYTLPAEVAARRKLSEVEPSEAVRTDGGVIVGNG